MSADAVMHERGTLPSIGVAGQAAAGRAGGEPAAAAAAGGGEPAGAQPDEPELGAARAILVQLTSTDPISGAASTGDEALGPAASRCDPCTASSSVCTESKRGSQRVSHVRQ